MRNFLGQPQSCQQSLVANWLQDNTPPAPGPGPQRDTLGGDPKWIQGFISTADNTPQNITFSFPLVISRITTLTEGLGFFQIQSLNSIMTCQLFTPVNPRESESRGEKSFAKINNFSVPRPGRRHEVACLAISLAGCYSALQLVAHNSENKATKETTSFHPGKSPTVQQQLFMSLWVEKKKKSLF